MRGPHVTEGAGLEDQAWILAGPNFVGYSDYAIDAYPRDMPALCGNFSALADYAKRLYTYDISGQHLVCADHISRKAQGWRTKHGFLQGQILLATQIMR